MFTNDHRVLFIIHDVYQDDNPFPLGPAYIAAMLKKLGAHVEIYCMDLYHYSNETLAEKLRSERWDLIGTGFMAARFKETILSLASVINANKKDAWLVFGGHGPSPIPEYVLRTTGADIVAMGEAEYTMVELLQAKVTGGNLGAVDGIAWRSGDKVHVNRRRKLLANLEELPLPAWELFPMEDYATSMKWVGQGKLEKSLAFCAGRGCINRCNFCYRMERGIRVRPIESIIAEIKVLSSEYGINNFYINDECFVISKKRIFDWEEALDRAGLSIKFSCDARVDILDEEIVRSLKRAGCQFLCVGFESTSDHVLQLMNKNTTVEMNMRALDAITNVGGIGVGLNFIWNNLGDTEETLWKNVALIKKYNTYTQVRTIRPVTPYPGCDLYYKAIELGLLKGEEDFFNKFKNSDLMLVNFMDMPTERAYELLLAANKDLIYDHFEHVKGDMNMAAHLVQQFKDLYDGRIDNFRGVRHYNDENKEITAF